jgi:4'-phosphopantetheinyl transferase
MSAAVPPGTNLRILQYNFDEARLANLSLNPDDIHIWQRQLASERQAIESLRRLLATDELKRADRFRFATNRDEYVVARGTLRTLLGEYLAFSPEKICFTYSQYGRPHLDSGGRGESIEFNISHSGNIVVLAFARNRRIGIDIEHVRSDFSTTEIAQRFFSLAEREALRQVPLDQRHEAFFTCWTRKEAFIKALGEGLSHPLDQFDVSLAPGLPAALLATRPDAADVRRWSLWNLNVPAGYSGALAAEIVPA